MYNLTPNDIDEKVLRRYWPKVDRSGGPDACWPWIGCRQSVRHGFVGRFNDYGRISIPAQHDRSKRSEYAHRIAYVVAFGQIPAGLHVMHTCDNPPCCNPSHLVLGTASDNARDRYKRGRWIPGEDSRWGSADSRIGEEREGMIVKLYCMGVKIREIADMTETSLSTVQDVLTRNNVARERHRRPVV